MENKNLTPGQAAFRVFWESQCHVKREGETWLGAWNGTNVTHNLAKKSKEAWEYVARR